MERRVDRGPGRRWLAVVAACCLIFQAIMSGTALGACALEAAHEHSSAAVHALQSAQGVPHGPDGHDHGHTPNCCFFACHLLAGKIAPPPLGFLIAAPEPAADGLTAAELTRRTNFRDQWPPQNPRPPPVLAG